MYNTAEEEENEWSIVSFDEYIVDQQLEIEEEIEFLSEYDVIEAPQEVKPVPTYAELVSANPAFQEPTTHLKPLTSRRNLNTRRKNRNEKSESKRKFGEEDLYDDFANRKIRRNKYNRARPRNAKSRRPKM